MDTNAWDLAGVIVRAITYGATFGAAGGVFFLAYSHSLISDLARLRIRRLIGFLILVAVSSSVLRIPLTAGSMSGEIGGVFDRGLWSMIWHAGEGRATVIRVAGLAIVGAAFLFNRGSTVPAILGAAIAATSFAWIGHPHALRSNVLAQILVGVHLLGVAFWLGALAPLLLVCRDRAPSYIAATALRFGLAAVFVVSLLIAAGAGLLWMLLGTVSELWTSPYGRVVSVKIGIVGCLLSAAAFNKLNLTPRLRVGESQARLSLRRSIWLEIILACAILIATATLATVLSPEKLG
ncbi:MAG: CopD family protein [Steroidobacteraceae bacterium]